MDMDEEIAMESYRLVDQAMYGNKLSWFELSLEERKNRIIDVSRIRIEIAKIKKENGNGYY